MLNLDADVMLLDKRRGRKERGGAQSFFYRPLRLSASSDPLR